MKPIIFAALLVLCVVAVSAQPIFDGRYLTSSSTAQQQEHPAANVRTNPESRSKRFLGASTLHSYDYSYLGAYPNTYSAVYYNPIIDTAPIVIRSYPLIN